MAKQYGLILPGGAKPNPPIFNSARNVFGEESDSGEEDESSKRIGPLRPSQNIKRQAKIAQQKAIKEDPTVYQYDELYDDMATKKLDEKKQARAEKKPKYIEKLMESADKRKRENERRMERQVQKEREAEGEQFADKEAFVTSAYKKKLEELRLEEEKEKREDYLEAIGDVTKQKDLDGFYRHLYEQKLQPEKCNKLQIHAKETQEKVKKEHKKDSTDSDSSNDSRERGTKRKPPRETHSPLAKQKRSYRKRRSSANLNDDVKSDDETSRDEINKVTLEDLKTGNRPQTHLQSNLDADSDFSIDSSSSEGEDEIKSTEKRKKTTDLDEVVKPCVPEETDKNRFKVPEPIIKPTLELEKPLENKVEEDKPKIDIWKKRTVGVIFEEALKRYYERKASRSR